MRSKKHKPLINRREFLNEDKALSAFAITVLEKITVDEDGVSCYPTFDISDCSNKVSLDFGFWQDNQINKVLKKAKLFKSIVNEFVDALEKEIEEYKALPKPEKKEKKTTKKKIISLVEK